MEWVLCSESRRFFDWCIQNDVWNKSHTHECKSRFHRYCLLMPLKYKPSEVHVLSTFQRFIVLCLHHASNLRNLGFSIDENSKPIHADVSWFPPVDAVLCLALELTESSIQKVTSWRSQASLDLAEELINSHLGESRPRNIHVAESSSYRSHLSWIWATYMYSSKGSSSSIAVNAS